MILDLKFRSGFLAVLCGFFVLSTASLCFAEEGETEMTQADSIKRAGQHLGWGDRYLKSGQYEDAETQLFKSWGFNPRRGATARRLGKLYNETEKYEDAIQWYQKAIELEPKSKFTKGAHFALAGIYIIQEQPENAIGHYEALLAFNLESEEKIKYYHALVSLNVETGEYEKALDYAKKWGELAPDDPEVRDMIGKLHLRTGGEDEALAEMEKVLEINPGDYATLEKLAGMYERRGDDDKAFDAFEKLYQNDDSSVFFLEETIKLGKMVGKPRSWVVNRLEKLHALRPDNLGVIEELAELTGSLKWVNKGLKQDPQNGRYPYMRGDHYFQRWENSSAKQDSINALIWY
ncbi:MAG: tetratricopeptide repeat protein, partial [Gemmatimonadota bacterium]|nr:tetratricopeptide repeat protein [Gemmatimonadota bacterium]